MFSIFKKLEIVTYKKTDNLITDELNEIPNGNVEIIYKNGIYLGGFNNKLPNGTGQMIYNSNINNDLTINDKTQSGFFENGRCNSKIDSKTQICNTHPTNYCNIKVFEKQFNTDNHNNYANIDGTITKIDSIAIHDKLMKVDGESVTQYMAFLSCNNSRYTNDDIQSKRRLESDKIYSYHFSDNIDVKFIMKNKSNLTFFGKGKRRTKRTKKNSRKSRRAKNRNIRRRTRK